MWDLILSHLRSDRELWDLILSHLHVRSHSGDQELWVLILSHLRSRSGDRELWDLILSHLSSDSGDRKSHLHSGYRELWDLILSHLHSDLGDRKLRDLILSHLHSDPSDQELWDLILSHLRSGSDHLCSLESLDLSRNNLGAPGGKALGMILSDLHLHTLILTETMLGDEGVAAFSQNLKDTVSHKLRELCLDNNGIQAAGISCLAKSVCTGRLQLSVFGYFTLANNPLGLEGVIDVVKILTSDYFQAYHIDLSGCQLTTAGGSATNFDSYAVGVQQLICSQQLWVARPYFNTGIVIDNNNFSGEGVHILATFMYIYKGKVRRLSCCSCGITSNDLKQLLVLLSELLSKYYYHHLKSLDLSDNDIDDDGVSALIQHLPIFPNLYSIKIGGNIRISPGMVKTLEEELEPRKVH